MEKLENAIAHATGVACGIGQVLREIGRMCPQAETLIEQDLENPEMSLEKCADAMKAYAKEHQSGGAWGCAVFGVDPKKEAVRVVMDFYKIPAEWLTGGAVPGSAKPSGGKIDLLDLL